MNFLQPWMLLGVLAALIPVVIHMINRRKAERVVFPMLEFVQRSQKKVARRLHLKRWLLLAARIGILLLIPLAMAQPYALCTQGDGQVGDRAPAAVVIIVDGSASMSFQEGGQMLRARAIEEARGALRGLRSWDQVRILIAEDEPFWLTERFTSDVSANLRALESHEFRDGASNLPMALLEARTELLNSSQPSKRAVLITDNAASAWVHESLSPDLLNGMGEVSVVSLRPSNEAKTGVILESLTWDESPSSASDVIELRALVRAPGEGVRDLRATLEVDGAEVGVQRLSLDANSTQELVFSHSFSGEGVHHVRLVVDSPEGVRALQERSMPVHLSRAVRALLVNGAASSVQRNDELFYLERALMVDVGERQAIRYQSITPDRLANQSLDGFDVVLLANVATLSDADVEKVRAFVRAGGGLWITPGAMVEPTRYNTLFADLLPRPIRTVTRLSSADDPDANIRATRFAHIDHMSPLFRIFSMAGGESLQSARVFSYLLLDPEIDSPATVLASYGDGGPAVLERTYGAGRVVLWTSTIDMDWTDLPIRTAYLPLVHRTMRYLAQRGSSTAVNAEVGALLRFELAGLDVERVEVTGPKGRRWSLPVEGDSASIRPPTAGFYQIDFMKAGALSAAPEFAFAANAPLSEAWEAAAEPEFVKTWTDAAREGAAIGELQDIEENRRRIWPAMLLVALVLIYMESLLSVRRRVWDSLRAR